MAGRLEGKVAVITGTGEGMGRAAALRFAREGAKVVGCDLKVDGNQETVAMVTSAGGEMIGLAPLDLTVEAEVEWLMATVEKQYGGIDILYNNAGAFRMGEIETQSYEDFQFGLTVDVSTVFLATKHVIPRLRARGGGSIVNVGSIAGQVGTSLAGNLSGAMVHCVSKAAVLRFTEVAAIELSALSVRVNAVSPGTILTPQLAPFIGADGNNDLGKEFIADALIDRIGALDDVVNAALFLASDEASFVTGSNYNGDGGFVASGCHGSPDPRVQKTVASVLK